MNPIPPQTKFEKLLDQFIRDCLQDPESRAELLKLLEDRLKKKIEKQAPSEN